jgi:hypothetical protein
MNSGANSNIELPKFPGVKLEWFRDDMYRLDLKEAIEKKQIRVPRDTQMILRTPHAFGTLIIFDPAKVFASVNAIEAMKHHKLSPISLIKNYAEHYKANLHDKVYDGEDRGDITIKARATKYTRRTCVNLYLNFDGSDVHATSFELRELGCLWITLKDNRGWDIEGDYDNESDPLHDK